MWFNLAYTFLLCISAITVNDANITLCGTRHSCKGRCGSWHIENGCSCDERCLQFHDCCVDYLEYCHQKNGSRNHQFSPFPGPLNTSFYKCSIASGQVMLVVSKCSNLWEDAVDAGTSFLCHNSVRLATDILARIPVYDNFGIVYANLFCATCNGVSLSDMIPYPISVTNKQPHGRIMITVSMVKQHYNITLGRSRACVFELENDVYQNISTLCDLFFAPVIIHGIRYRNIFCQVDNAYYINKPSQYCFSRNWLELDTSRELEGIKTVNNFLTDETSPFTMNCSNLGEIFDPTVDTCRLVGCPRGSYQVRGSCLLGIPPSDIPQVVLSTSYSAAYQCLQIQLAVHLEIEIRLVSMVKFANVTAPSRGPFVAKVISDSALRSQSIKATLSTISTWPSHLQETFYHQCGISVILMELERNAQISSSCTVDELSLQDLNDFVVADDEPSHILFALRYESLTKTYSLYEPSHECLFNVTSELNCHNKTIIQNHEWRFEDSEMEGTINLKDYDVKLTPSDIYLFDNGSIIVCTDKLNPQLTFLDLFYYVSTTLSLISLALTFLTYLCFPVLRNLPGLCLMNLVAALFFANFTLLFADILVVFPNLCAALAALTHFTWLASFAWMFTLSFNMARTFGYRSPRPFSKDYIKRQMIWFSLLAWGVPAVMVAICVTQHICQCLGKLDVWYGSARICWINGFHGRYYGFVIPVAILLSITILLFIFTATSLRQSRHSTRAVRIRSTQFNDITTEIIINVRVSIIRLPK